MLKRLRFFQMELPSLRYMTQAGGKLSPELHREFAEYAKIPEKIHCHVWSDRSNRTYGIPSFRKSLENMAVWELQSHMESYG